MKLRFAHRMRVRFADTDAQGHMFFANYLTFCDEALTAYVRAIGCPYDRLMALEVDMFYVSSKCDYKGRSRFEDELAIHTRIARVGNSSFTSECFIYNGDELVAEASLTSVCVNSKTGGKVPVPDVLRDAISQYEQAG